MRWESRFEAGTVRVRPSDQCRSLTVDQPATATWGFPTVETTKPVEGSRGGLRGTDGSPTPSGARLGSTGQEKRGCTLLLGCLTSKESLWSSGVATGGPNRREEEGVVDRQVERWDKTGPKTVLQRAQDLFIQDGQFTPERARRRTDWRAAPASRCQAGKRSGSRTHRLRASPQPEIDRRGLTSTRKPSSPGRSRTLGSLIKPKDVKVQSEAVFLARRAPSRRQGDTTPPPS